MNERTLRPETVAAATGLLGGILLIALPQHAMSVVRLVVVTIAVGSALYVLAVHVPTTGWISPFKWMSPFSRRGGQARRRRRVGELDVLRASLGGRRQQVEGSAPLPPGTLRTLQPMIALALDFDRGLLRRAALGGGADHDTPAEPAPPSGSPHESPHGSPHELPDGFPHEAAQGLPPVLRPLSARERRTLAAARRRVTPATWAVLTAEPLPRAGWFQTLRPDARAVSAAVHRILDELDGLMGVVPSRAGISHSSNTSRTRANP